MNRVAAALNPGRFPFFPGRLPGFSAMRTAVVFLTLLAAGASTPVPAQERAIEIASFHSAVHVRADGNVDVTETLRVRFTGSWNGIVRAIPVEYATGYGANYTLLLDMRSIEDEAGSKLRNEESRAGRNREFKIWVPGAQDAERTVILRYRVRNGLRFFDEHDELYWNVTGTETEFTVERASARVILPEGVSGIRSTAFTGVEGSVERAVDIREAAGVLEFVATRPLGFREGLTVVVGWNPGIVKRPSHAELITRFLASNVILLVPVLAFFVMLSVWRRHGRDPELGPIAVQYEPPDGLTPAEAGTIVDNSPDMRDITATIVDLAVRKYIVIEEVEEAQLLGLFSSRGFAFRRTRPPEDWQALKTHERKLLDALFDGRSRDRVTTSELENEFYRDLPGISAVLSNALVRDGHYLHHPSHVRLLYAGMAAAAGALVGFGGSALLRMLFGQPSNAAAIAGVLTGLVIAGFGLIMPARTMRGARVLAALRGFEEFLQRVEADRFERIVRTPELFEKFLPFAMAFGVEKKWANAFDDIYQTPPDWYHGRRNDRFLAHVFVSDLGRMAGVTSTAMTKAPRSSSSSGSSGFSGGGFSGGGFGGGGVRGF
jgi:hypothetical protein